MDYDFYSDYIRSLRLQLIADSSYWLETRGSSVDALTVI